MFVHHYSAVHLSASQCTLTYPVHGQVFVGVCGVSVSSCHTGGCADVSLLAHLSDVPHWSLVQACSSPAPWLSTSSPIAPWQAQSLPHPERALPTHSIHSGTLLTPSRTPRQPPAPVSMPFLGSRLDAQSSGAAMLDGCKTRLGQC